jgi:hypothetical protein
MASERLEKMAEGRQDRGLSGVLLAGMNRDVHSVFWITHPHCWGRRG